MEAFSNLAYTMQLKLSTYIIYHISNLTFSYACFDTSINLPTLMHHESLFPLNFNHFCSVLSLSLDLFIVFNIFFEAQSSLIRSPSKIFMIGICYIESTSLCTEMYVGVKLPTIGSSQILLKQDLHKESLLLLCICVKTRNLAMVG